MVDRHLDTGFGRDGISGMLSADRATRARELSRPDSERIRPLHLPAPPEADFAAWVVEGVQARAAGRRRSGA